MEKPRLSYMCVFLAVQWEEMSLASTGSSVYPEAHSTSGLKRRGQKRTDRRDTAGRRGH